MGPRRCRAEDVPRVCCLGGWGQNQLDPSLLVALKGYGFPYQHLSRTIQIPVPSKSIQCPSTNSTRHAARYHGILALQLARTIWPSFSISSKRIHRLMGLDLRWLGPLSTSPSERDERMKITYCLMWAELAEFIVHEPMMIVWLEYSCCLGEFCDTRVFHLCFRLWIDTKVAFQPTWVTQRAESHAINWRCVQG